MGGLHDQQVTNNQLEVWDTNAVPDNTTRLRLTGVKNDGNWEEYYVRNLQVSNSAPQATATPSATATPDGSTHAHAHAWSDAGDARGRRGRDARRQTPRRR